jgi:hypothetical protein
MIGIYGNAILFEQFPTLFNFWTCLVGRGNNDFSLRVTIDYFPEDGGKKKGREGKISISTENVGDDDQYSIFIPVPPSPIEFDMPGKIIVRVKPETGGKWTEVSRIRIGLRIGRIKTFSH